MIFSRMPKKNIDLQNDIKSKIQSGKTEELLLVVPTNRKSRYLKEKLFPLLQAEQ